MKTITFLFFFFSLFTIANGQQDTLNRYADVKRNGIWRVYLNKNLKEVKDSNKAYFSRFKYYDYGLNLNAMGHCENSWKLIDSTTGSHNASKIKLMNGTYTWIDEKGITRAIIIAKNGNGLVFKWYHSSGALQSVWDYSKEWHGMAHSYSVIMYDKDGNAKYYHFHKTDDKRKLGNYWALYPCSKEEF